MQVIRQLGHLSLARFMREYWQRRPVLIRNALPGFSSPVTRTRLFDLAAREDVESRLLVRQGAGYTLRNGPFPRRALPGLATRRWTLLVQGVDALDPAAHALLALFRFLPDARLDDLMVSYATDGGGVPPHVDNYDVFLVQAQGTRRWRVSRQRDPRLRDRGPLQVLADFRPTSDWLVRPGDVVYLPPGTPHEGVAVGECITCSIGFRAPTWRELHDPWLARFAEHAGLRGRYSDPGQRPTRHPAALPAPMLTRVHAALGSSRPTRADTERFLLEYLSEPKAQVVFRRPARLLSPSQFARAAGRRGVRLHLATRMLTSRSGLAINGEFLEMPTSCGPALRRLADRRALEGARVVRATAALRGLLREWFAAGWLQLGPEGAP